MVKIRLMRVGKRKQPSYRVVVADARSPRDGRIIETLGHYQPRENPSGVTIDNDRAVYWLQNGAQPSSQVRNLLKISGAWSAFTGEAPPPEIAAEAAPAAKPRKATPAASVSEPITEDEPDAGAGEPADLPEAVDQESAAPEAETTKES